MKIKPVKTVLKIITGLVIFIVILFFAVSPLTKYLIEHKSEEWTGRKITIGKIFINLFTFNATVNDLCIYENKSDSVFFRLAQLNTGISLKQLIGGKYFLSPVEISSPRVVIEQKGNKFNFDDLLDRFSSSDTAKTKNAAPEEPVKYRVEEVSISDGTIIYRDKTVNQTVEVKNLSFRCPLLSWDSPELNAETSFSLASGGHVQSGVLINYKTFAYTLTPKVDSLNIHVLQPWIKDFVKTAFTGGLVSGQLQWKGDFNKPADVAMKGNVQLSGFRFEDESGKPIASCTDFQMNIDTLNVADNVYYFGGIKMVKPFILFEMYEKDNNFTRIMVPSASTAASIPGTGSMPGQDTINYSNPFTIIRDYVKLISSKYLTSNYKVDELRMQDGHIIYKDYTLEDKFSYDLNQLQLKSSGISSKADSIHFEVMCLCNGVGHLKAHLSFDPREYKNMAINYSIDNMRIADFNPYSKFYVAHSFFEGSLFYTSTNTIRNGKLESANLMNIKKIEVSRRIAGKGLYTLPLRLAICLLRDKDGNIKLDIPVEGDLNDPKYKLGKVIWQVLKNIVVKAATAPFNLLAKAFGADEKELKEIPFDYLQNTFDKRQVKSLDLVEKSLAEKSELKVSFTQIANRDNEKELMALFNAKKNYYLDQIIKSKKDSLSGDDYKKISGISNRDSLFNNWLNSKLLPENVSSLPSQIKSRKLMGEKLLNEKEDSLFSYRNRFVTNYLVSQKQIDSQRIKIKPITNQDSARFETTPHFAIDFFVEE